MMRRSWSSALARVLAVAVCCLLVLANPGSIAAIAAVHGGPAPLNMAGNHNTGNASLNSRNSRSSCSNSSDSSDDDCPAPKPAPRVVAPVITPPVITPPVVTAPVVTAPVVTPPAGPPVTTGPVSPDAPPQGVVGGRQAGPVVIQLPSTSTTPSGPTSGVAGTLSAGVSLLGALGLWLIGRRRR